jgi:hypothetical protein
MRAICHRFGLPEKQPAMVARADAVLLATEVRDLMSNRPAHWRKLREKPLLDRIPPWSPDVAEYEFLRRFRLLTGRKSHAEERITDLVTGGQKGRKDERYDLFPFDDLDEVAGVYAFGARKYADDNWLKGYSWRLSLGALLRHVARWACGEDRDPETGCLHLAHAASHSLR